MNRVSSARATAMRRYTGKTLNYIVLSALTILFLWPFVWLASGSLKSNVEFKAFPPTLFGSTIRWDNYTSVFTYQPFARQYLNSVIVLVAVCALTAVVSAASGYVFARVRVPGANIIFLVLLSGLFMPVEATILPVYRLVSSLGWIDTLTPLIVVSGVVTSAPIGMFIMRQAYASVPGEFADAASVDGAGRFRVFARIYTPMVMPSISAVVIYTAWQSWNQFLEPLLFLRSADKLTVPVALTHFEDLAGPLWGVQSAAAVLSVLPVILLFLMAQRQVIAGLTEGGIK